MDRISKFLAYEGRVRVVVANTTELVEYIRNLHDLSPIVTAALGRVATVSGMMGFLEIKEQEDSITIQINGKGPAGKIISVVKREDNTVKIKACVDEPHVDLPLKGNGKLDVGKAVGKNGFLNIINKNSSSDYSGLVPLVSGEIAEDFTSYYAKSKQIPTVIALGVLVDKRGVKSAGGYIIQLMPDALEEDIQSIEKSIENIPNVSKLIDDGLSIEKIAKMITGDENIMILNEELNLKYECDCSKEKFEKGLISLGKEEISNLINDGKAEVTCQFCNKKYNFEKTDLERLYNSI